jgi:hypothetical protein
MIDSATTGASAVRLSSTNGFNTTGKPTSTISIGRFDPRTQRHPLRSGRRAEVELRTKGDPRNSNGVELKVGDSRCVVPPSTSTACSIKQAGVSRDGPGRNQGQSHAAPVHGQGKLHARGAVSN